MEQRTSAWMWPWRAVQLALIVFFLIKLIRGETLSTTEGVILFCSAWGPPVVRWCWSRFRPAGEQRVPSS